MDYRRIIPCLDLKGGRVVKGINFVDIKDAGDPAEAAKFYSEAGADELVLLDINASFEGRETMLDVVAKTAEQAAVPFCVGGGISSADQIRELLRVGADKVSINTPAVLKPEFIGEAASQFGSERIVVAIDVKKTGEGRWEVVINGGRTLTGKDPVEWAIEAERMGAGEILLTSMETDGTRSGYDLEITRMVADAVKLPVTASGGAGRQRDFSDAIIEGHADAVLAASLFHFRILEIKQVKEYLRGLGIPVNLQ